MISLHYTISTFGGVILLRCGLKPEKILDSSLGKLAVGGILSLDANLACIYAILKCKLCQEFHASQGLHREIDNLLSFHGLPARNEEDVVHGKFSLHLINTDGGRGEVRNGAVNFFPIINTFPHINECCAIHGAIRGKHRFKIEIGSEVEYLVSAHVLDCNLYLRVGWHACIGHRCQHGTIGNQLDRSLASGSTGNRRAEDYLLICWAEAERILIQLNCKVADRSCAADIMKFELHQNLSIHLMISCVYINSTGFVSRAYLNHASFLLSLGTNTK
mmetsp:Transcript_3925/g.5941  ORF Transcript_3925/g.5941 Transcript_3925/m.5941 type:complete len:275 (-) Transcript_3925:837-1661(-)